MAHDYIKPILKFLDEGGTLNGTEAPFRIYLTCYKVLKANHHLRAFEILSEAYNLLQTSADNISDKESRHSFLNNVTPNREIIREYKAMVE